MYAIQLQGNRVTLHHTLANCPSSDVFDNLSRFYDDEDVVFTANNAHAYATVVDADRARLRALDRKRQYDAEFKRARITEFSRKSRYRLLKLANSLDPSTRGVMLTLTYRSLMTDHVTSKKHLELMLLYLKRKYRDCALLWRLEYQARGAIHYHVMILSRNSVWIDIADARARWRYITNEDVYPNARWIDDSKRAIAYVSKYVAKYEQSASVEHADQQDVVNLDIVPYSDNLDREEKKFVGRFWGVTNRQSLPVAELTEYVIDEHKYCEIVEFRRAMSLLAKSKSRKFRKNCPRLARFLHDHSKRIKCSNHGFTLFANADSVSRWIHRYTIIPDLSIALDNRDFLRYNE